MKKGIIEFFATHRVAANLLMAFMLISGLWALTQMNVQFLPTFHLKIITVSVNWPGANAEDVERGITLPLEEELHDVDHLKKMIARNSQGVSSIILEFKSNADMNEALENVKQRVSLARNLPVDAEPVRIIRAINYEEVARLIVAGGHSLDELRPLIRQYEKELIRKGIAKISIAGLPEQEIAIQIPVQKLNELGISLDKIATLIDQHSKDVPAGSVGKSEVSRELRSKNQKRTIAGFASLPLLHNNQGHLLRLGDIATITKRVKSGEAYASYQGKPAVQMILYRTESSNALTSARILHSWLDKTKAELPKAITIKPFFESWKHIKERVTLLLKNAFWGLTFIIVILFLFLNFRIALWVAIGIPASFLAAIAVLYLYGGSINMVSLFGMIMTLGIIVDDSIVVGEEVLAQIQTGSLLPDAIRDSTNMMLPPIFASSLTTIVAFIPLMLVGGIIGQILFDIPLVAICVITASLVECFLVLPGHLYHNLKNKKFREPILQKRFNIFREKYFRPLVKLAIRNHWTTISISAAIVIITIGILLGGYTNFTFFPSPETSTIQLNTHFSAGTSPKKVKRFTQELERSLIATDKQFEKEKNILVAYVVFQNRTTRSEQGGVKYGDQYASMYIELTSPDRRKTNNDQFITAWKKNINFPTGVEQFTISRMRSGPPGKDSEIEISGKNLKNIKAASTDLSNILENTPGVYNIRDELPFGKNHIVFALNPQAHALNLTTDDVGKQLRAAFSGKIVQIYHEQDEEIEVRVMLPDHERYRTDTLITLPIITPKGNSVPLSNVVSLTQMRGFDEITHINGILTNRISADVNANVNNMNTIIASLNKNVLPKLKQRYDVSFEYAGRKESQTRTLHDMLYGLILAFVLIYIILAWVFSSYGWPLLILMAIPLGLVGAVWGHIFLGMNLTVLSLFGFFGLSGIVINDSIILVNRYRKLRQLDLTHDQAIVEASCQRLRPVLLTSLTTIAGLLPLVFERSLQAQFLIPMAVSIVFGLLFATVLILVLLPSMLHVYERLINKEQSPNPQ